MKLFKSLISVLFSAALLLSATSLAPEIKDVMNKIDAKNPHSY